MQVGQRGVAQARIGGLGRAVGKGLYLGVQGPPGVGGPAVALQEATRREPCRGDVPVLRR